MNWKARDYVDIHLNDEMVRVEAGALSYLEGDIRIHSRLLPSIGGAIKSLLADEAIYRPTYVGTGVITLESTLGGFHVLDLNGESWILERGAYWASDGDVDVSYHRERMMTALWAGEGPVYLQTKVKGHGKVVVTTRGPVEEISLDGKKRIAAEGKYVICRTGDVSFKVRRSTQNYFGGLLPGRIRARIRRNGEDPAQPAPYWRYRVFTEHGADPDCPSATTT